jgi:hypothetical protein
MFGFASPPHPPLFTCTKGITVTTKETLDVKYVRASLEELLDSMEASRLPTPQSISFGERLGITWMLEDDLEGTQQVLRDFKDWHVQPGFAPHATILETETEHLEITLWAHPDAVSIRVEVND